MRSLLERLTEAMNTHDAERVASYFAADYRSSFPAHPGREFTGRAQVLANWTAVFTGVPDFHADLVTASVDGDAEWGEWSWTGRHQDGAAFAMRGVVVAAVRDGLMAEARLYLEPVETTDDSIEAAVNGLYGPAAS